MCCVQLQGVWRCANIVEAKQNHCPTPSVCLPAIAESACGCIWRGLASRGEAEQGSFRRFTVSNSLPHLWLQLDEARQRENILKAKQDRDAMLAGKAANIARIRRIAHAQAAVRRHQTQERQAARAAQVSRVKASPDGRASFAARCTRLQCCLPPFGLQQSLCSVQAPGSGRCWQPGRPGSLVCKAVQACLCRGFLQHVVQGASHEAGS